MFNDTVTRSDDAGDGIVYLDACVCAWINVCSAGSTGGGCNEGVVVVYTRLAPSVSVKDSTPPPAENLKYIQFEISVF